jgi:hypothetical protein
MLAKLFLLPWFAVEGWKVGSQWTAAAFIVTTPIATIAMWLAIMIRAAVEFAAPITTPATWGLMATIVAVVVALVWWSVAVVNLRDFL